MDNLPAWISAGSTLVTSLIALWLFWHHNADRRQSKRERSEAEARKVAAWCDTASEDRVLFAQNYSSEPIYDFVGYIGHPDADLEGLPDEDNIYMDCVFGMIPSGKELDCEVTEHRIFEECDHFPALPVVAWEFTDGSGRHWRRDQSGHLRQTEYRRPFD